LKCNCKIHIKIKKKGKHFCVTHVTRLTTDHLFPDFILFERAAQKVIFTITSIKLTYHRAKPGAKMKIIFTTLFLVLFTISLSAQTFSASFMVGAPQKEFHKKMTIPAMDYNFKVLLASLVLPLQLHLV
jgi:hypothetical protein